MKILIAGEGKTEIGYWTLPAERHTGDKKRDERGIIEAFVARLSSNDWTIIEGIDWRRIPKYKARRTDERRAPKLGPEGQTVRGLALRAEEKNCNAVIFVRDRDDEPDREKDIDEAIATSREQFTPQIAGGVAAQSIESWLLSLKNEKDAERYAKPKKVLRDNFGVESLADKVAIVDEANLDEIRQDARSLRNWLDQVRAVLQASSAHNHA